MKFKNLLHIKPYLKLFSLIILITYFEVSNGTGVALTDLYCDESINYDLDCDKDLLPDSNNPDNNDKPEIPDSIYEPTMNGYNKWWKELPIEEKLRIHQAWRDRLTKEFLEFLQELDQEYEDDWDLLNNYGTLLYKEMHVFSYFAAQLSEKQKKEFVTRSQNSTRIWGTVFVIFNLIVLWLED